jgi:hypothetical protein
MHHVICFEKNFTCGVRPCDFFFFLLTLMIFLMGINFFFFFFFNVIQAKITM